MIKAKIKMNLSLPRLKLQDDLVKIGDKIIIPDLSTRIFKSVDISNRRYAPLSEATKKIRNKKHQGFQTLVATGELRRSMFSKKFMNGAKVSFKGSRSGVGSNRSLADILQNIGVKTKSGKRFFEFFGISKEAERDAMKYMRRRIDEAIDRGERRIVK